MIVANTNLIGYLLLPGPLRDVATQIFLRDRAWHAPLLWRSEFASTLLGFVRRGDFDLETALDLCNEAMLLMENMEHAVNGAQVMRLALLSGCTAYDCEFLALAEWLNVPLVTAGQQVLRAFPGRAISLLDFIAANP